MHNDVILAFSSHCIMQHPFGNKELLTIGCNFISSAPKVYYKASEFFSDALGIVCLTKLHHSTKEIWFIIKFMNMFMRVELLLTPLQLIDRWLMSSPSLCHKTCLSFLGNRFVVGNWVTSPHFTWDRVWEFRLFWFLAVHFWKLSLPNSIFDLR